MPGGTDRGSVAPVHPVDELDRLDPLAAAILDRASASGAGAIWRAQVQIGHAVVVRDGKAESTSTGSSSGHGIQVFTPDGWTVLASRDDFRPEPAIALVDRAIASAQLGARLGLRAAHLPDLRPVRGRSIPEGVDGIVRIDLLDGARRLAELERAISDAVPGVTLKLGLRAELDAWRIARSDGTDVRFAMPRCTMTCLATAGGDGGRHGVGVARHAPSVEAMWNDDNVASFRDSAARAADLARRLPDAPVHPAGSFPFVIDYALAKGLAHEAFGHAAEADGYRSSVLASDGRFDVGREVGASHVSIVDEPIEDDHAWQPFSANGVRRERATIVRHGRLEDGLADLFSAAAGGVRATGAARAESFRSAPLPRMTNIRIEVDGALPADGRFEDYGPDEVRDLLARAGVFRRHREIAFLSGYGGGQVNTALGDFVFQCKAIWRLSEDGVRLFRPAIFSGSMFGALRSIREAFGPLRLDALGWCGKWGQSVPSSGGSHWFLVLDPDPTVRLGGAS